MRWFRGRSRPDATVSKPDPVLVIKADWVKPDPVKADPVLGPATPVRVSLTALRPPEPASPPPPIVIPPLAAVRPLPASVEDAADDLVTALSERLIEHAGDELEAPWSLDDPGARVEELLEEARFAYGDVIVDRVEADAWSVMFDTAQDLADQRREEDGNGDW